MRGFWHLVWVEIRIFLREPLGVIGTIGFPIVLFLLFGRSLGRRAADSERVAALLGQDLPIFASVLIAMSASLSLIAVISIYREGGILKRLRATPLRPVTILSAHVVVKLLFTLLTLALLVLAGRRLYPVPIEFDVLRFVAALVISTITILSIGFVIASAVTTARFAQPIGSALLYPMLFVSGLFVPLDALPAPWGAIGSVLPITHAVGLLRGAWVGAGPAEMLPHLAVLGLTTLVCTLVSGRIFRWE